MKQGSSWVLVFGFAVRASHSCLPQSAGMNCSNSTIQCGISCHESTFAQAKLRVESQSFDHNWSSIDIRSDAVHRQVRM